jgi:hypothetical protein
VDRTVHGYEHFVFVQVSLPIPSVAGVEASRPALSNISLVFTARRDSGQRNKA